MSSVRRIKAGTTDVSVIIRIIDSTDGTPETGVVFNTSGIDLWYRREGAASVDITEADLATPALTDAHADGGFLHINDGWYRLDLPDAACAAGVTGVQIGGTVTGMVVLAPYIELVAYDPYDTVRLGLTALPNAAADAAGGLIISDAGGLDADAQAASVAAIETDTAEIGAAGAGLTEAGGTGDHLTAINLPNQTMDITGNITGNLSGSVGSVTGNVGGTVAELGTQAKADVKAEIVSALATDTYAEPTGVPPATDTLAGKLGRLAMMARNQVTVTASKKTFFDDAGNAEWEKDLSDDGTTYTETEANSV